MLLTRKRSLGRIVLGCLFYMVLCEIDKKMHAVLHILYTLWCTANENRGDFPVLHFALNSSHHSCMLPFTRIETRIHPVGHAQGEDTTYQPLPQESAGKQRQASLS